MGKSFGLIFDTPLEVITNYLSLMEHVLNGLVFPFHEKIVSDKSFDFPIQEKIVSLLSCDVELVSPTKLKLTWSGEKVPFIEVLRKEIADNSYGQPIATIPFEDKSYTFNYDNNSYIYSVRGSNGTGSSMVEITIGVKGLTTINSTINLGDFVKIYEGDIGFVDKFEVEVLI
jgi:hypothetical protein